MKTKLLDGLLIGAGFALGDTIINVVQNVCSLLFQLVHPVAQ